MSTRASESHLRTLRRLASERARERNETLTTIHLLAATWAFGGPARALLDERRLDEQKLLSAARAFDETDPSAVDEAMGLAQGVARRGAVPSAGSFRSTHGDGSRPAAAPEPSAIHLLQVLLSNRRYAAYRALRQCGVDIANLRSAATRIALGVVAPPRKGRENAVRQARVERARRAVEVPLIPPKPPAAKPEIAAPPSEPKPAPAPVPPAPAPRPFDALWLDDEQFPTLASLRNLTLEVATGQVPAAIGREREVEQTLDVLAKCRANNPLLVGPAGVGKTTVARAVARRFLEEPEDQRRVLLELPPSELLSGTGARGSLAERLSQLRREVEEAQGRVVLLMDEIHELFASGALDEVAGELKDLLGDGELPIIGTTTPDAFRRCIEADPAIARRFGVVDILEPSEEDAVRMLRVACEGLAEHHGVRYGDAAIAAAVSWSIRYLPGRALPDKALGVLDLAGARLGRRGTEGAVTPQHIAEVMADKCDVPLERLLQTDAERMLALHRLLRERVVGHDEACDRIAAVLRRNAAGLRGRRPIGTFLLLGPTGVGKTEMAKAIAAALFHSPDAMTRLDMSEFAEAHAVARLIGAPPGYVGHEAGGMLTEALRKRPYQVVLLDEIEKAHRDVQQAFLQVFDEGRMTDGRGRTVEFHHAVIVLTSNLGSDALRAAVNERRVGFGQRREPFEDTDRMHKIAVDAARAALPPELYNRIDEVLFFRHLQRADVRAVAERLLADLRARLKARDVGLDVEDAAIDVLLEQGGYDAELGARPMRRAIVRLIEAPLADMILRGELEPGSVALIGADDGELSIDAVSRRRRKRAG